MTKKQRRSVFILFGLSVLGIAVALVLVALEDTIVFFYSPSDVVEKKIKPGTRIRLGGLVKDGTVNRSEGVSVSFEITDTARSIPVRFKGVLPDLFREGQGVIAEGVLQASGGFKADNVLAKHDEKYMPPEVADALKKQGVWKPSAKNDGKGS